MASFPCTSLEHSPAPRPAETLVEDTVRQVQRTREAWRQIVAVTGAEPRMLAYATQARGQFLDIAARIDRIESRRRALAFELGSGRERVRGLFAASLRGMNSADVSARMRQREEDCANRASDLAIYSAAVPALRAALDEAHAEFERDLAAASGDPAAVNA
jgi:hypothetical protein